MLNDFFENLHKSIFKVNVPDYVDTILNHYSPYYRNLSDSNKEKFNRRLLLAAKKLEFIPNNFPAVTNEMIVLITSALIQITFGLRNYKILRFTKIYVVPYNYNFGEYQNLLGHVDYREQCICMSWPSVQEGFIIPDDAMNVALHEIAHALQAENRFRILFNKFFSDFHLNAWEKEGVKKLYTIRQKQNKFLNDYGGINMLEMFSVCIETFFEQPEAFQKNLPDLFNSVSALLKQNPMLKGDPRLR